MSILFGTNRRFDLRRLPFSSAGSFVSVYQDADDKQLYITIARSEPIVQDRPRLVRIAPIHNDKEIPFIYYCDETKLTIETKYGIVEFTFEIPQTMRIRVTGIGLRVFHRPCMHEGGVERRPGEMELAFSLAGKLLFKEISGKMENNAAWDYRHVSPRPFEIDILPSSDTDIGEVAVHEYESNFRSGGSYIPFDEATFRIKEEFEAFFRNYPDVSPVYRDMARKAAWLVWSTTLGPRGALKKTVVYMHKVFSVRAFGWHQCFHAMAMKNNPRMAWDLMTSLFDYQNEKGGIPDSISDLGQKVWISSSPPVFGFTTVFLMDHFDLSEISTSDYEDWYKKLSLYYDWWYIWHDHSKTGFPSYYHADESGYEDATLFLKGLPIQSPDLIAYMVLLCEALSRLAKIIGQDQNARKWMNESERALEYLTNELWDGEQFLSRIPGTGELHKCGSIAQLQPVILGKRLPEDVMSTLACRLTDESLYLTDCGVSPENLQSKNVVMDAFSRGAIAAPTQLMLILGLLNGGETEAAEQITSLYLNALLSNGFSSCMHPYRIEPVRGNAIDISNASRDKGFPFAPLAASIFLNLAWQAINIRNDPEE